MRRFLPTVFALVTLGSCAAPTIVPHAAPPPPVAIYQPPPPPPSPTSSDWRDWPLTPGDWRYAPVAAGSTATFGAGSFAFTCNRMARRVTLSGAGIGGAPLAIRTTSVTRSVAATPVGADLAANDPLLDAIAFSRGRFVVEQAGQPTLVLPVYAEIGRVIEDCRG